MSDRMKTSRLELRLEAGIIAAPSVLEADCKRAELAAYRARLGRFEEVRQTLIGLHQRYDPRPQVAISAWLNFVEGLAGHFGDMDPAAPDKVLRSYALSSAAGLTQMRALSAAWLAHLDYLRTNVDSMTRYLGEALSLAEDNNHSVLSRANLVLAQAYHVADNLDSALPWYHRARVHAVADGDEATVSALIHNMAWLRAHNLRQKVFLNQELDTRAAHVLLSAESTINFDNRIGATSLQSSGAVLRAQILTTLGREAEALELFAAHIGNALVEGRHRPRSDLMADMAWCRAKVGQIDQSLNDARRAEKYMDARGQFDVRALAHSRLSQVFELLCFPEDAERHRVLAQSAWADHSVLQRQIVAGLAEVVAAVDSKSQGR